LPAPVFKIAATLKTIDYRLHNIERVLYHGPDSPVLKTAASLETIDSNLLEVQYRWESHAPV
jgi:hypothetical protein